MTRLWLVRAGKNGERLQGAMANAKAAMGLLVSLSGVTPKAQKILDDNFFTLRLWQMPELLAAVYRTYHRLPDETRARLPLKQIWIPVARDGVADM